MAKPAPRPAERAALAEGPLPAPALRAEVGGRCACADAAAGFLIEHDAVAGRCDCPSADDLRRPEAPLPLLHQAWQRSAAAAAPLRQRRCACLPRAAPALCRNAALGQIARPVPPAQRGQAMALSVAA